MVLSLFMRSHFPGEHHFARPVVELASSTLLRRMNALDAKRAWRGLDGLDVYMKMVRMGGQAGKNGVPPASPMRPGRVGYGRAECALTIDVHYNEINMVLNRVKRERPGGRTSPVSRDFLDTFVERMETAVAPMIRWCDEKDAWADKSYFTEHWNAALAAARDGKFFRPYEFALTPALRDALDTAWMLVAGEPLESEEFDPLGHAYLLLRDTGWSDAKFDGIPERQARRYGRPRVVSNFDANLASSRPPDPSYGYSPV